MQFYRGMSPDWDPDFSERSPLFEPLRLAARALRGAAWPDCALLNRCLADGGACMVNARGLPLSFVPQPPQRAGFAEGFEPRTLLRGEIAMRPENWHDLFNALVWLTFPRAKAALNARHYHELEGLRAQRVVNRGAVQDALTLFDESGVVIAVSDPALGALIREFRWKELFWVRRNELQRCMRFYVYGHALYEKALHPYRGLTGRALLLDVAPSVLGLPMSEQLADLDQRVAAWLADHAHLQATRELAPVPILGVPGWCGENGTEQYYDDAGYFRPGRG